MTTINFLDEEIKILKQKSVKNKKEVWQLIELITYLAARQEITLIEALTYTNLLLKIENTP